MTEFTERSRRSGGLLLVLFLVGCTPSHAQETRTFNVPVAPPAITVIGETSEIPAVSEPFPLSINLAIERDGSVRKPRNLQELVTVLWNGLSPEYRRGLALHYGFESNHAGERVAFENLRISDLERFLLNLFDLDDSSTRLGREAMCMSPGEGDLNPILALVVEREIALMDSYDVRRDIPEDVNPYYAITISEKLASVCREFV